MKVTIENNGNTKVYTLDTRQKGPFHKAMQIVLSGATELDILDRRDYFAVKLWSAEDIKICLERRCFEPSDENVRKVEATGYLNFLEECTDGELDTIYDAIEVANAAKGLECMYPARETMIQLLDNTVRFAEQDCVEPEVTLLELQEMGFTQGLLKAFDFTGSDEWDLEPDSLEDMPKEEAFALLGSIVVWFCENHMSFRKELLELGFPENVISAFGD